MKNKIKAEQNLYSLPSAEDEEEQIRKMKQMSRFDRGPYLWEQLNLPLGDVQQKDGKTQ
jgi:hypothetical protein